MCQLRLFLFLHALTLSFSLSLFVCFGSVQLFELLHIVFNIKRILIFFSWSRVYIIYMRSYTMLSSMCVTVCGKYFSYKLPDAIHSDFSFHSLIYNRIFTVHLRTHSNYVQNKLYIGFILV